MRHVLVTAILASSLAAQGESLSYAIEADWDPATRTIHGTERIRWTNPSRAAVRELRLHLYLNAFASRETTLMRELPASRRAQFRDGELGAVGITAMKLSAGDRTHDLMGAQRAISPDDANPRDATVLQVELPEPVNPNQSITLDLKFEARLPKAYLRAGWIPGGGVFAMQWYPKLGVLEDGPNGSSWNCRQYHANTEFFADFASYEVKVTVPEGWVVGATGGEPVATATAAGRTTRTFRESNVHDFAWVADPDFRVHEQKVGDVNVRLLLHPHHDTAAQRRRHFDGVECAFGFYGERFGPYPYKTLTVVDPGEDLEGHTLGGGMEYPTLITCATTLFPHGRGLVPESVTVHEAGHQWWYGLSANDEAAEAWLDEGLNTFSQGRAMALHYGAAQRAVRTTAYGLLVLQGVPWPAQGIEAVRSVLPSRVRERSLVWDGTWLPASPLLDLLRVQPAATHYRECAFDRTWHDRALALGTDNPDPMVKLGYDYFSPESYRANAYHRPVLVLHQLERFAGRTPFWAFLRHWFERSRLRHPTTAEFVAALRAELGVDAAGLFDELTRAGPRLDYGIASVDAERGVVVVRRHGTLRADLTVRFVFANRPALVSTIPARDEQISWRFAFPQDAAGRAVDELREVWIDPPAQPADGGLEVPPGPAGVYWTDSNLLDNAWRATPDPKPALYRALRLLHQTQNQLTFAGWIG